LSGLFGCVYPNFKLYPIRRFPEKFSSSQSYSSKRIYNVLLNITFFRKQSTILISFLLRIFLLLSIPFPASGNTAVQSVRIVMDNNYPPYVFMDATGHLRGILIDQWALWEKKTGIHTNIVGMDWDKALGQMETGHFDVIDTIFENDQRKQIYDFSKPYARIDVQIFFQKDISGITDVASIRGFFVAVKSGDACIDYLIRNGVNRLVHYSSYESIVDAARAGAVTMFVMDHPPAMYYLFKLGIQDRFRFTRPLYSGEFHRAVLKNRSDLLPIIENGFSMISERELNDIDRKWFGNPAGGIYLRYLGISVAAIIMAGLFLLVWNWILRRSVRKKTGELKEMVALSSKRAAALQVSEEKYRLVVENANEGILIIQRGMICFVNRRLKALSGYTDEDLIGKPFLSFLHPDDQKMVEIRHAQRLDGQKPLQTYSIRILTQDNGILWAEANAALITWENKPGVLAFLRDITLQKMLEQQLLQSQRMEAVGTLAGGVAHDFNNLLMGIQGYTSLILMDTDKNHPHYEKLKHIEKQVLNAANLTRRLLEFARGGKYQAEPIRLNDLILNCSEMFGRAKKEITFHYNLDSDLCIVEADKSQIEQVLVNILMNARQAMPSGGNVFIETRNVHIETVLAAAYHITSGTYAAVMVTDSGAGMDETVCQRVFEPFFSTKGMGQGAGLGLASAYGIIHNHEGAITVSSKPGKGACFTFYLPELKNDLRQSV
jgi:PAS domain S-box-containing protein